MTTPSSDIEATRQRIEQKREALSRAKAQRQSNYTEIADELEVTALRAEEARLDAELGRAQVAADPDAIRAANEANLALARQALRNVGGQGQAAQPDTPVEPVAAPASQTAPSQPVRTNTETGTKPVEQTKEQ